MTLQHRARLVRPMYCNECAEDREDECPYHELFNCPSCGAENSVRLEQVTHNPADGDEYSCDSCDFTERA